MKNVLKCLALASVAASVIGSSAEGATATTTFAVTASVASACAVTATALAFGSYDPSSATPLDGSTSVVVLCTIGTSYNVGLNAGAGTGASIATRKMTASGNTLDYTLYSNSGRTTVWGNTVGTNTVSGTYALAQPPLTVYGRVPAGQSASAGNYTDTITVTITY